LHCSQPKVFLCSGTIIYDGRCVFISHYAGEFLKVFVRGQVAEMAAADQSANEQDGGA
jgi:hypothetical protein